MEDVKIMVTDQSFLSIYNIVFAVCIKEHDDAYKNNIIYFSIG